MNFARFIIFCFANICILCSETTNKIYVTLQGINKVGILYDDTMDTSTIDIDYDLDGEAGQDSPHFIVIDKINRYWFVTTFRSEYVGRYNLDTDQLIDIIPVGDAPALMVLNEQDKKLYVSRMMPMGAMMTGAISTVVQEIDYSDPETMELSYEFSVGSPTPHGLAINQDGSEIYVASNTADWLYKIIPATNERDSVVMDPNSQNIFAPNLETDKLKPIQCISVKDSLLFITCSGGITSEWNSTDNVFEYYTIPGQVQLWNTNSMTIIDSIEFNWESHPWHIIDSPIRDEVFVALAGESDSLNTAGVVCLSYASNNISLIWENYSDEFNNATLHGIDISNNGETLFVSGREDGYLHILDAIAGTRTQSISFTLDPSEAQPTGIAVLSFGCDNVWGSGLIDDECGVCGGDNNTCFDCEGTMNGSATEDYCGTCDADSSNDCVEDCAGEWGGTLVYDECGKCNGDGINGGVDISGIYYEYCDCDGNVEDCNSECGGGTYDQDVDGICDDIDDCVGEFDEGACINNMAISNISYVPQIITLNNYPNPFNPQTTISFSVPNMQNVSLEIIDLKGRVVKSFFNRHLLSGSHSIVWYAESYPSGQYLINMSSDTYRITTKTILIK